MKLLVGGVPEHFNYPFVVLAARGLPRVEVQWRDYPGGSGALAKALDEGELDLALMLTEGAVAAIAKGGRFRVVSVYTSSPLVWGIHVSAASQLRTTGDLRGRRYAMSRPGSGSQLMALVHARQQGWPEPLEFVEVGNLDGAVAALRSGAADVFLWEKSMTQPLVTAGRFRRVGDFSAPWPAFVACAPLAAIEQKGAELRTVLAAALAEAARLSARDPDSVAGVARHYSLPVTEVTAWLERTRWAPTVGISSELEAAAAALMASGVVAPGFRAAMARAALA